jgi:hypothetical protein
MNRASFRTFAVAAQRATFVLTLLVLCANVAQAQVSVWTHHNNNQRTGANLNETVLNTSNVNVNQFGRLFSQSVDADMYGQPLVVPGVNIPGKGAHNVVYVATQNDSVYAFDADSNAGTNAQPLWKVNFTNAAAGITAVPAVDVTASNSGNIRRPGPIGIMGTPVIDLSTGTMYLVARTKENGSYFQRLHALDITTGAEKFGGPVAIQATAAGNTFNPMTQNQRPGLALDHGIVYIAWSSHDDMVPYHGWVIGYQASNLQQTGVFNDTPNGTQGGIWQSGQPPAFDASGNLYLMTGNGTFSMPSGGSDVSESFVKLRTSDLALLDWFAQCDVDTWNNANEDLNSAGVLQIPNTTRIFGGGKQGRFFLLDTANLGQVQQYRVQNCTNPQIPQSFQATTTGHIHGSPVFFTSPTQGSMVYVWAEEDYLKSFSFNGSTFTTSPSMQSTFTAPPGMPGGFLSVSSNGSQAGTGIVWATMPFSQDAENAVVAGILRAFDASNLSVELWNSRNNIARDDVGNFAKFVPLTIANGKVYAATFSNQLVVYGLNPPPAPNDIRFIQVNSATPQQATATVAVPYQGPQLTGDTNIVVVGWNDTTSTVQSVTDSTGNAYTLAIAPTQTTGLSQALYYAKNVVGGNNTVTVKFNAAAAYPDIRILEYSGLDQTNPLESTAAAVGTGTQSSTGSVTTTGNKELLFAANTVATGTTQPASPFVARVITNPDGDVAQDAIVASPGTYTAAATLSPSGRWVMQLAAFKGAGSTSAAPQVTTVAPATGPTGGGTVVTITGTSFASGATVSFSGTAATNVAVVNSTSITATAPAHAAGTVNVAVANPDGQSGMLANAFTYATPGPAPTISGVSPNSGSTAGATSVQVNGANFVSGATVSFGGTAAAGVTFVSTSALTVTTPAHASGAVNVVVTNPDAQSATLSGGFTYLSPPSISSVSPSAGPTAGGTSVTISGANFASGATVSFGGTAAAGVVFVSASTITATTPAHAAGAVNVVVTNPGGLSATLANAFTYGASAPAPTVTGVSPTTGPTTGGTAVQISGTNFVSGATASFGGTAATGVSFVNATTLNATTPAHAAGAVNVVVTNPDGQSGTRASAFTYGAAPPIAFVQVAAATPQAAAQTVSITYPVAQTAGNLNIVVVGWNDTTSTVQSVVDSAGNAYALAIGPTTGTGLRQSIYYAPSIRAGGNSVTVTFNGPAAFADVRILEYSGVSALDAKIGASGNSGTASSGAATTTTARELIFGANTVATGNKAAGSGFTSRIITDPDSDIAEDRTVSATGSYSATATLTAPAAWVMQMVTFK